MSVYAFIIIRNCEFVKLNYSYLRIIGVLHKYKGVIWLKVDNIFLVMSQRNITAKELSEQTGISAGNISDWKSGRSSPKADALTKIADYFDVSVDYLLDRTDKVTGVNSHNTISGNNNIIGNGNTVGERLSEQEKALFNIFKNLDIVKQAQLLAYAVELEKEV